MTKPRRSTSAKTRPRKVAAALRQSGTGLDRMRVGRLLERVVSILENARAEVVRSVNSAMVIAYWQIGSELVESHQGGARRAGYGDQLLEVISTRLEERVGRGYSVTNLRYFRLFYQTYADREPTIRHKPCDELLPDVRKRHKARDASAALELASRSPREQTTESS